MPRGEVKKALREAQILDAAYAALRAEGYVAMSMDDVAHACGIGKATLYQHFPSKEELVVSVAVRGMQQGEQMAAEIPTTLPALEHLSRIILSGIHNRTRYAPFRIHQVPEVIHHHPRLRAQLLKMHGHMAEILDAGKARGEVREDVPTPVMVAHLMQTFGPGLDQAAEMLEVTPDELAERLMAVVVRGLAVEP